MTQKLSEQLNRYFNLMESIREQLFRTLPISSRYICVVSFSTQYQAVLCDLVSKESLLPAKLLDGLTGQELVAYGTIKEKIERWAQAGMVDDFPIDQDADVYAQYRKAVGDSEEDEADSVTKEQMLVGIQTSDRPALVRMAASLQVMNSYDTRNMDAAELRDRLINHFGLRAIADRTVAEDDE